MQRSALTISLHAPDVRAAVAFYEEHLGFPQTGSWSEDEEPIWAEVSRDGPQGTARIWFFANPIEDRPGPVLSGVIYVFVENVDAEAERLRGKLPFRWGPEDQPYGLRELGVEDLNGYLIVFAKDVAPPAL